MAGHTEADADRYRPEWIPEDSRACWFPHPSFLNLAFVVIPDSPHVEKLMRNSCYASFDDNEKGKATTCGRCASRLL
jgi:hypothetical protein